MFRGFPNIAQLLSHKNSLRKDARRRSSQRHALSIEPLESRVVLSANSIGSIRAFVDLDLNGNGVYDQNAGEEVAGAQVKIYLDDGNGAFDANADTLITTETTDATGMVFVDDLASGNYFVVQCAGTFNGVTLEERVSSLEAIDGAGVTGTSIDDFSVDTGPVTDVHPPGTAIDQVFTAASALGGERDLSAEILNGNAGDTVEVRTDGGRLLVNPDFFAIGEYSVSWDGNDASGAGLDETGLGGIDLTTIGGNSGFGRGICLNDVSFDQPGAEIVVRVYTSATQFSEATITNIPAGTMNDFFLPFDGTGTNPFTATGGGADFTNVGAVEMVITATNAAMDGTVDSIGVVGIESEIVEFINEAPTPSIDVEKFTNGAQADDPGDADVPVININNATNVTWTYTVTNDGQIPLTTVSLVDDQVGTIGTSSITNRSINNDTTLDVGETWTYTVTGTPTAGDYTNKATATGSTAAGASVMDMDTSNYRGIGPSIDIEKTTNGFQADLPTDADVPQVSAGSTVTWVYTVTNTGTDPLSNVTVNDSDIGGVSTITSRSLNNDLILDVGEVWTYTAVGVAINGSYANTSTVVGTASDQSTVTDSDDSHYVGLQPAIDIEKSTNNEDADITGTGPQVFVGSTVTFRYRVTNTGGLPLSNVVVTDDAGTTTQTNDDFTPTFTGGDTDSDGMLDLTETWTYEATRVATLGSYTNIGRVTGIGEGTVVNDADASNHSAIAIPEAASKRRFLASAFA